MTVPMSERFVEIDGQIEYVEECGRCCPLIEFSDMFGARCFHPKWPGEDAEINLPGGEGFPDGCPLRTVASITKPRHEAC